MGVDIPYSVKFRALPYHPKKSVHTEFTEVNPFRLKTSSGEGADQGLF